MQKFWDNKPALKIALPLIAGIVLADVAPLQPLRCLIILAFFLLCLLACHFLQLQRVFAFFIIPAFLLIGCLLFTLRQNRPADNIAHFSDLPVSVAVQGHVCEPVDNLLDEQIITLQVDSLWALEHAFPVSGKIRLQLASYTQQIIYGDVVVCRGHLRAPRPARNPGEFDYKKYLRANHIDALFYPLSNRHYIILAKSSELSPVLAIIYQLRRYIIQIIHANFAPQHAAILKALLVGSRASLDDDIRLAFANSGVIHLLAVSGLHVGFILALFMGAFTLLRLPNPYRTWLVISALCFYTLLTGLHPPVFRATVMGIIFLAGTLLYRRADALNSIAIAAIVVLTANPYDLFQPGFQLSFCAVCGIVLIYTKFHHLFRANFRNWYERNNRLALYFFSLLLVSAAAQLATLPLIVFYFGKIPILALIANLFAVPLVAAIVALAFIALLFSIIYLPLAQTLLQTVWLLLHLLIKIVSGIAAIPFSYIATPQPQIILLIIYFLFLLFAMFCKYRQKFYFLASALLLLNIFMWMRIASPLHPLTITFFDVGQADCILLQLPNGRSLLVDTGDQTETFTAAERIILPFLQRQDITHLDALLLTHDHADHVGGAEFLLQHIPTQRVIKPAIPFSSDYGKAALQTAAELGVPVFNVSSGDSLFLDEQVPMLCLHPSPFFTKQVEAEKENVNNSSLVLYTFFNGHAFLFMGDAEAAAEQRILSTFAHLPKVDVLKCGHHGSRTATTKEFLAHFSPDNAIISVGKFNRFSLPHAKVLQSFRQQQINVLRTDIHGAVQYQVRKNECWQIR